MKQIITGFHAIEEKIRSAEESGNTFGITIHYSKIGPRVKKILQTAKKANIASIQEDNRRLSSLVRSLPETARDHRGIVLEVESAEKIQKKNEVEFDGWLNEQKILDSESTVLILDSITDPHNVGAILRSCDQFGTNLVVIPSHRSQSDFSENETIARSSAGAAAYVPVSVVTNLVRATQKLKDAGFWIYGADAGGESVQSLKFPKKTAIVMGSEGSGISKLLEDQCDSIVSIPTCGKIDSLNVSVAAGVLLYERFRQRLGTHGS